jgi:hypothetical protein
MDIGGLTASWWEKGAEIDSDRIVQTTIISATVTAPKKPLGLYIKP